MRAAASAMKILLRSCRTPQRTTEVVEDRFQPQLRTLDQACLGHQPARDFPAFDSPRLRHTGRYELSSFGHLNIGIGASGSISPKSLLLYHGLKIAIRRGDQPCVSANGAGAAQAFELPLLQNT